MPRPVGHAAGRGGGEDLLRNDTVDTGNHAQCIFIIKKHCVYWVVCKVEKLIYFITVSKFNSFNRNQVIKFNKTITVDTEVFIFKSSIRRIFDNMSIETLL